MKRQRYDKLNKDAACSVCGVPVSANGRAGLCQRCYLAKYRGWEKGTECDCCGQADPRALVRKRLDRENWSTLCGNCATRAGRRKMTVDELHAELFPDGDRRQGDRRNTAARRRLPVERRSSSYSDPDEVNRRLEAEARRASGDS